jgi:predicted Zn-dependent protease with MMP-like domain
MFADWPIARRIAASSVVALAVGVLLATLFNGLSTNYPIRLGQVVACVLAAIVVIGLVVSSITMRLADYSEPADDEEFELLVRRTEQLARENLAAEPDEAEFMTLDPRNPEDFEELVRQALDDLPDLLLRSLDHVGVMISDKGRRHRAYGLYVGDTVARDNFPDRIIIFRDTLLRDFGHDPDELRAQVTRTVRHELAHHLGADELGVREMGL